MKQTLINTLTNSKNYKSRFIPDGGKLTEDNITKAYYHMAEKNGIADNIEFGWMSGGASKKRVDGITSFYTDLYDFYGTNDATQTTASSQPYVSGNIAPNEVECLKNPNGDSRVMIYPEISFAPTDSWSWTGVLNLNNFDGNFLKLIYSGNNGLWFQKTSVTTLRFYTSMTTDHFGSNFTWSNYGQNDVFHVTYDGTTLKVYINGIEKSSDAITFSSNLLFNGLWSSGTAYRLIGNVSSYIIRSVALTAAQVSAEHALLREIYPEIPSVKIGEQEWSTSNLEMVATPEGNVIPNVTEAANVEKATENFSNNGLYSWDTFTGVSPTGFTATESDGSRAVALSSMSLIKGKAYKYSFDYVASNLSTSVNFSLGATNLSLQIILYLTNGTGAKSGFFIASDNYTYSGFRMESGQTGDLTISNFSVEEVGWSGLGDLFTDLTTNQGYTDYEAYKECAAWCYYNNDSEIGSVYGKLYNWYAAKLLDLDMLSAGFGWRVPTQAQFNTLATALGGASVAGGKMKVPGTDYWDSPNTGATNESGFSGIGSSYRSETSGFDTKIKQRLLLWGNDAYGLSFLTESDEGVAIYDGSAIKDRGNSIRLIKE